ncbi:MAG: hypothetical protein QM608_01885 [Caulobacter sp.]
MRSFDVARAKPVKPGGVSITARQTPLVARMFEQRQRRLLTHL